MTESDQHIREFAESISVIEGITCDPEDDVRDGIGGVTLDFTIGDIDEYRVWVDGREHRVIHRGSLAIGTTDEAEYLTPSEADPSYLVVTEISVHLPPLQEGTHEWQDLIDTKDRFALREQSSGLSTVTPYPSPHIQLADDACSFTEAKRILREAANAYEEMKDNLLANRSDARSGLDAGRARRES